MRQIDVRHEGIEQVICCYALEDVIIDPGPSSTLDTLLEAVGDEPPAHILLTHVHLDHAGAAGTLARLWPDADVWVHERGARHVIDPSKLVASAARIYGDDMDRLWGAVEPVPEERLRILTGGERIGPLADRVHAGARLAPRQLPARAERDGARRRRLRGPDRRRADPAADAPAGHRPRGLARVAAHGQRVGARADRHHPLRRP